jgi:signal transduction histidine kinase
VGFSSLLTETEDMKDRKQYMAIVQENTELLLQLISDILDLSKMESGAFEFVKSDTDVNLLCSEIIRSLRMKVPAGVELVFEECLPGCHVWADKNRLNQVISNFINNALKFTFSGSITLGYYRQTDGYLRFYVRDTGMGIPKNKIKTVFDRFVKLNSFVHGTGLGLSICKSLVEQMGGTIGVESEEGEGSCFWFTYPYQEIAYGEFIGTETVTEYTKFEFDIKYSNTESKPAKIAIVATSSKYGGDFDENGKKVIGQVGDGSTLWVDEFELGYE